MCAGRILRLTTLYQTTLNKLCIAYRDNAMLCTLSFVYCIFWIWCSSILWTFLHNELLFLSRSCFYCFSFLFRFVSSFISIIRNRSVALPYVLLITYSKLHPLLSRKRIHTTQYDILSNDITSKWTIATGHTQHHSGPSFYFIFRFFFSSFSSLFSIRFLFSFQKNLSYFFMCSFSLEILCLLVCRCVRFQLNLLL